MIHSLLLHFTNLLNHTNLTIQIITIHLKPLIHLTHLKLIFNYFQFSIMLIQNQHLQFNLVNLLHLHLPNIVGSTIRHDVNV